jgi:membrane dipeptidase
MIDDALVDAVHAGAFVADAHADSLLWNRDLNERSRRGHADFPRLLEAGVRLQCFTLVTRGLPVVGGFALLAAWNGWPREARRGEWARAVYQLDALERACERSGGRVAIARTRADLARNAAEGRLSAVLGVEGAHALGGEPERVETLWARGVRFMSLTHLSNSEVGGSSFRLFRERGLTALGREILARMALVGMAVDLAHASRTLIDEVLAGFETPVFCSHTGVQAVTPMWRNLPDRALERIAARGGVVGIVLAREYLGGGTLDHFVRHVEHALEVAGEDHVGLGSDFDGMIHLPRPMRDARDLKLITRALLERGHPPSRVQKVMGENLRRFFQERALPP